MDEFCFEHPNNAIANRRSRLIPIDPSTAQHNEVENLFREGWKHPNKELPKLHAVYKITFPESSIKVFLRYQSSLVESPYWSPFIRKGAQSLLFHGTNRACLLGENSNHMSLCNLSKCSLCSIIRRSFDISKCGSKHHFTRFGIGVYTTSCSSKADDYSRNAIQDAKYKAVILSHVAVGETYKLLRNATHLKGPPSGFHSVTGVPGIDLNYEETVVYSNDAIRPAYLLVYSDGSKTT